MNGLSRSTRPLPTTLKVHARAEQHLFLCYHRRIPQLYESYSDMTRGSKKRRHTAPSDAATYCREPHTQEVSHARETKRSRNVSLPVANHSSQARLTSSVTLNAGSPSHRPSTGSSAPSFSTAAHAQPATESNSTQYLPDNKPEPWQNLAKETCRQSEYLENGKSTTKITEWKGERGFLDDKKGNLLTKEEKLELKKENKLDKKKEKLEKEKEKLEKKKEKLEKEIEKQKEKKEKLEREEEKLEKEEEKLEKKIEKLKTNLDSVDVALLNAKSDNNSGLVSCLQTRRGRAEESLEFTQKSLISVLEQLTSIRKQTGSIRGQMRAIEDG